MSATAIEALASIPAEEIERQLWEHTEELIDYARNHFEYLNTIVVQRGQEYSWLLMSIDVFLDEHGGNGASAWITVQCEGLPYSGNINADALVAILLPDYEWSE